MDYHQSVLPQEVSQSMALLLARVLEEVKGVGQHDPDKRTAGDSGSNSSKCTIFATFLLLTHRKFQLAI